jgi:hypothetical protein
VLTGLLRGIDPSISGERFGDAGTQFVGISA